MAENVNPLRGRLDAPQALKDALQAAIETYVQTEFAGLTSPEVTMTRLVQGSGGVAAHWRIQGTHGSLAQPSTASGPEFLGWQPTGANVDLHVATFSEGEETDASEKGFVHEWDRLHGLFQIGVHAVGRPLVGSRPGTPSAPMGKRPRKRPAPAA